MKNSQMDEQNVDFGNGLTGITCGGGEKGAVILSHGAGRGMDSPILVQTAHKLADLGFKVLRYNFAYLGRRPAPSAGGKNELPELISAMDFMQQYGPPILVGKSFGARVSANAALTRGVRGLVFYGMPLQGMSKTAKPRDWSHLASIKAPMLFVTGDKDQLCPLDRLQAVLKTLTAPTESVIVAGDHSYKPKSENAAVAACLDWIQSLPG